MVGAAGADLQHWKVLERFLRLLSLVLQVGSSGQEPFVLLGETETKSYV